MNLRFVLVGHSISSNATGRLLAMADVAAELGHVKVCAFGKSTNIWPGSTQFEHKVQSLGRNWKNDIDLLFSEHSSIPEFLWMSKGISPLDKLAEYVHKKFPRVKIILDLDDDDSGLAEDFAQLKLLNAIKLNPFRRGSSFRIKASLNCISRIAVGYTISTNALAVERYPKYQPYMRVPHARRPNLELTGVIEADSDLCRKPTYGCFGTLRPHKGSDILLRFMRNNRDWNFVSFKNCGLGSPRPDDSNWIEISGSTPLSSAYRLIDIALLPMMNNSSGSRYQLPAKLVDAMREGKIIIASETPAIIEIAAGCFIPLPSDVSEKRMNSMMLAALTENIGEIAHQRYLDVLTPIVIAEKFSGFAEDLIKDR